MTAPPALAATRRAAGARGTAADPGAPLAPAGAELVFVPGDPPRTGTFAWYHPSGSGPGPGPGRGDTGTAGTTEIEVVVPTASRVRRRRVPAVPLGVVDAVAVLGALDSGAGDPAAPPSARATRAAHSG